jgi:hypothetical protein
MSRRDLAHVLDVLWERSGGEAGIGVAVADIDAAIGRGHDDMRTPLNLRSLADDGRAAELDDGRWALTPAGAAWLAQDRDLSGR